MPSGPTCPRVTCARFTAALKQCGCEQWRTRTGDAGQLGTAKEAAIRPAQQEDGLLQSNSKYFVITLQIYTPGFKFRYCLE